MRFEKLARNFLAFLFLPRAWSGYVEDNVRLALVVYAGVVVDLLVDGAVNLSATIVIDVVDGRNRGSAVPMRI